MIEPIELLSPLIEAVKAVAKQHGLEHVSAIKAEQKRDGSVVTAVDLALQQQLLQQLQQLTPDIAVLAEEMVPELQQRLLATHDYLWVVDPLDGTTNFAAGLPWFAISVALLYQQQPLLGVIYDPLREECFSAIANGGAWLNREPIAPLRLPTQLAEAIGLIDFKRLLPSLRWRLSDRPPYTSQRSFGSGALDWCWIATGRCHLYLHGRQSLWDYAAGWLILQQAGGESLTLEGERLFAQGLERCSVVAASSSALFELWYGWVTAPSARLDH
ncbi:inositol monophosphatase [Ectothiorhodospiraceae bacterium BW-2]|nr:inositol monophosphatase [Ectothiorhodospiraceae bacterium BW-2]